MLAAKCINKNKTNQNYNFGYISGPVADLPAGELSVLVGYEERTESYKFTDSLFDEAYIGDGSGGMTDLQVNSLLLILIWNLLLHWFLLT